MRNKRISGKKTDKNKGGRPSIEITDKLLKEAETLGSRGMTQDHIALALGMGRATLYEKKARCPEFSDAIARGKALGIATVTEQLIKKCKMGDKDMIKFYLSRVAGMVERKDNLFVNPDSSQDVFPISYVINFVDGDESSS